MGDFVTTTTKPFLGSKPSGAIPRRLLRDEGAFSLPPTATTLPGGLALEKAAPLAFAPRPIFALNPLEFKRDKASSAISFVIHAVVITLVLSVAFKAHTIIALPETSIVMPVDFKSYIPPVMLPVAKAMGGGGGGGAEEIVEASKGHLPKVALVQITPPQANRFEHPKFAIEPSEQVRIPDSNSLPNLGVSQSPQVLLVSQGRGSGSGFGQGTGGGIGMGHGGGVGAGSGGAYGGGLMSVGGGVAAPQVLHSVEPEFTQDARQANFQGSVLMQLIVDSQGNPQDIRVTRHLGMGLDEKAIEAVRQYKFKPAMYQGHPVSVQIVIDVDFHLH
jgi:TonB family protein